MQVTFLRAAVSLSKSIAYSEVDDVYTTSAYPMVKKVSSHVREAVDMFDLHALILEEGAEGHSLLFGGLTRTLKEESRAGFADKTVDHEWLCFDFDKVDLPPTIEGAKEAIRKFLPEWCHTADAVVQLSPSCFNPDNQTLSAHVFMKMDKPMRAARVRELLTWLNFTNEHLSEAMRLTESGNSLTFKLDRCIAEPSRLIYIAPPRCIGFETDIVEHTVFVQGEDECITVPHFDPISREQQYERIYEMRAEADLPNEKIKTVRIRDHDVLSGKYEGVISEVQPSGEGFIRFNINGGNSLGYWLDLRHPDVIGNFKGEPYLMTKSVDDKFYAQLVKAAKSAPAKSRGGDCVEPMAFYATNRDSQLHIGTYDRAKDILRVDKATQESAAAWLKQHGVALTGSLPHYDLVFDLTSDIRYEEGFPVINLYQRTDLMKKYGKLARSKTLEETMTNLDKECPVIMMFLRSMTGDDRSATGFVNWFAYIFQTRLKTGTAWLLWGTEGTGKGKFFSHVVQPLLSPGAVGQVMMGDVEKDFNSLLEGKLFVAVDEAEMSRTRDTNESMAKLRNWITEPTMVVNRKHVSEKSVPSFCNFVINANSFRPMRANRGDRRYHVATRQETRLIPTANQYATLVQGEELPAFAKIIGELVVDEYWVRNPEFNEAKARLFDATHSVVDSVAMAITEGDTRFFFEARPSNILLSTSSSTQNLPIRQYDDLLRSMVAGTLNVLRDEDLYVLFHTIINDEKKFSENQLEQRKLYRRYGFVDNKKTIHCERAGRNQYGTPAGPWQDLPLELQDVIALKPVTDNVASISKGTPKRG